MRGNGIWLLTGVCAAGSPALAQTIPSQPPTEVAEPAAGTSDAFEIEEIVVTATRRTERLQDVPASIGVIAAEELERRGVEGLDELAQSTAGLTIAASVGINTVFIRGVGGGGRNVGFGTRAGIYVDGVYVGQFASINQSAADVERVEVLRGPQGTLFGRNSVSGAISIVTRTPNYEPEAYLVADVGSKDLLELRWGANIPLVPETIALRLSGVHRERGGFTRNLINGQDLGNINRDSLRGQLRWDVSPDLNVLVSADWTLDESRRLVGEDDTNINGTAPSATPGAFDVRFNTIPLSQNEFYGGSVMLNYAHQSGHSLTSITALRRVEWTRVNDTDYSAADILFTDFNDRYRQFSQEVRLASPSGNRLNYVLGFYFLDDKAEAGRAVRFGANAPAVAPVLRPGSAVLVSGTVKTRSLAAFATVNYNLTERLELNLGGRYTNEKIELEDYFVDGRAAPPFGIAFVPAFSDSLKESRFDPTIGLSYKFSPDLNGYVKYSQGFKSGGFNVDFLTAAQFAEGLGFRPERARSYEVGLKSEFFDRRLRLNLAAYVTDYADYQINQFVDLGGGRTAIQLRNAAKVRTSGGELEAKWRPTADLTLGANLAYVKAEFKQFTNGGGPGVNLDGNQLPQAPKFTSSIYGDYSTLLPGTGLRFSAFAEYNRRGASFSGAENLVRQALEDRDLVNARLGLSDDDGLWSVEAWVENALDESYAITRDRDFLGTLVRERGDPRTYGITTRLKF